MMGPVMGDKVSGKLWELQLCKKQMFPSFLKPKKISSRCCLPILVMNFKGVVSTSKKKLGIQPPPEPRGSHH